MQDGLSAIYGLGRLAFGAGMMTAPEPLGELLAGDDARQPPVRLTLRLYGTRDTVLGIGTLRAIARAKDPRPWIAAGVAADVLDTALQLVEWEHIPPSKRLPGVAAAVGAASIGIALLWGS
jgi:hypothetical protein